MILPQIMPLIMFFALENALLCQLNLQAYLRGCGVGQGKDFLEVLSPKSLELWSNFLQIDLSELVRASADFCVT